MTDKLIDFFKSRGRLLVALVSLTVAFALSVQFNNRGVHFDLEQSTLSASESKDSDDYQLSDLKVLNRALLQIKDNYVEPKRIEPTTMLTAALDEIQNALPAVVVNYKGNRDKPKKISIQVEKASKTFDIETMESLWEMSFRLKDIFHFIEEHTQPEGELTFRDIEYTAVNGILATLDPHSTLLPPKDYKEMRTQTGGEFGGLGIVISIRDGRLTVISPIDGTPASKKGIKARDKIVRIEDESTINMNLNEAVSMLRGKPGTQVNIWIKRKGWSEPRKFTVTRDIITIKSVNSEPLGDKVGYVRIKNFQSNTYGDLKKHLGELKEKMGGVQGLVLDLRDNPGGLLDQAIKISDLFLKKGAIVSTVGAGNKMRDKKVATRSGTEPNYPMIVLVNAGSASASEIVSGALQNHDRALVLGDTTFGKGTVQVLYEFPDDAALKLTIAQYLTPGGVSIQSRGITPDLRLIPAHVSKEEVNMFLSDNILREQDLDSHLSNKAAGIAKSEGVVFLRYLMENQKEQDEFADPNAFREDFQIRLGQQLLAAADRFKKRPELLKALQPELEKIYNRELGVIQKKLEEYDIDWSAGPSAENTNVSFEIDTSNHDETLKAGDEITMTGTLTNNGDEPVYRVKAITSSATNAFDDREFLFGHLEPGQSKSWSVDVKIPKDTPTRHDIVKFRISDDDRNLGEPREKEVLIEGLQRPQFAYHYTLEDDSGDGIFQVDEEVIFRVSVENIGEADSAETLVYLKNLSDEAIYLETGRVTLNSIKKGDTSTVEFKFRVKEAPKENQDAIKLELDVYDSTFREFSQKKFEVPFSDEKLKVEKVKGKATVESGPAKVFVSASNRSNVAATVAAGSAFPVVAKTDKWLQLDLGKRKGWIQASYAKYAAGASTKPGEVASWSKFQAPTVKLSPQTRMTSSETVNLKGHASDNSAIKDYYIFVYHREDASKIDSNKVAYSYVGAASTDFSEEIPLFKGMNRIAIVARDDADMSVNESVYIYRK